MMTDNITYLMGHWAYNYLDDVVRVSLPSTARQGFTSINNFMVLLGLPINSDKVVGPAEEGTCLGFA